MAFAFPDMVDARQVADDAFAAAYDSLAAGERAVVKAGIARMAAVAGDAAPVETSSTTCMRQGFYLHEQSRPASWAAIFLDEGFASPARLLAALLPAILAGVPEILVCRTADGGEFPAPLLAALELAGQETVVQCSPDEILTLLAECCNADSRGRLVFLGGASVFDRAAAMARENGTPVRHFAGPVRIGIAASSFGEPVCNDHLRFAHPDAAFVSFEGDAAKGDFAAVFCANEAVPGFLGSAPLVLTPDNEAFWHWPGVDTAFYRARSLGVYSASL